jgi:hypothetical protein
MLQQTEKPLAYLHSGEELIPEILQRQKGHMKGLPFRLLFGSGGRGNLYRPTCGAVFSWLGACLFHISVAAVDLVSTFENTVSDRALVVTDRVELAVTAISKSGVLLRPFESHLHWYETHRWWRRNPTGVASCCNESAVSRQALFYGAFPHD